MKYGQKRVNISRDGSLEVSSYSTTESGMSLGVFSFVNRAADQIESDDRGKKYPLGKRKYNIIVGWERLNGERAAGTSKIRCNRLSKLCIRNMELWG